MSLLEDAFDASSKQALGREWSHPLCGRPQFGSLEGAKQDDQKRYSPVEQTDAVRSLCVPHPRYIE